MSDTHETHDTLSPPLMAPPRPPRPQSPRDPKGPQSRVKTTVSIGLGNALEWFDWTIYAIFTPFFAQRFFNPGDALSATLSTLAVFAIGFAARPVGGFVFGWISDHRGRRFAMTLSVATAAAGSLVIGVSPTYQTVGAAASFILLIARLGQGLAHGGELPAAQTYVAELAPAGRRGLWSSLIYISGTLGIMAGTALGAGMASLLQPEQMSNWGWRVPFVVGGLLGLYTLVMRRRMPESEIFEDTSAQKEHVERPSAWNAFVAHRKQALQVVGMTVGFTVVYWAWAISTPTYAITNHDLNPSHALWAGVAANAVFVAALPLWGKLSDRIGRKPVLLTGMLGMAVLFVPLRSLLGRHAWQLGLSMSIGMIFIAAVASIAPAVYAELFPTRIRTLGVGVPYACSVALFGGTAPYLQTWIGARLGAAYFTAYVVALLLISAAVMARLPETRAADLR